MRSARNKSAEVYIGVIIAVGIFLILSQTIAILVFSVYDLVIFNRTRTTARFLAEEKIEIAKNLSFNELGTVGGIPAGILEQEETIVANGLPYLITTRVDNIDDDYDGTGIEDVEPVDYKKVDITVTWGQIGRETARRISLSTIISPQTDIVVGGGTIDITVSNSLGQPVAAADVTIVASSVNPPVNTTLTTDADGKISIPGAITCSTCYEISATKTGYSTDKTYGTDEVVNPAKPDITVVEDQVSIVNFTIDTLAELNISSTNSRASNFSVRPNTQFILRGSKIIGTDATGEIIYKYAQVMQTGADGKLLVEDLEWDAYYIVIPTGTGNDVTGTNPLMPLILSPGESSTITFSADTGSDHRLIVEFVDSSNSPIASVAATLVESGGPYEASSSSGFLGNPDFGQVFYGNLTEADHVLYATVSGYLEFSSDIVVTDYTKQRVILIPE